MAWDQLALRWDVRAHWATCLVHPLRRADAEMTSVSKIHNLQIPCWILQIPCWILGMYELLLRSSNGKIKQLEHL